MHSNRTAVVDGTEGLIDREACRRRALDPELSDAERKLMAVLLDDEALVDVAMQEMSDDRIGTSELGHFAERMLGQRFIETNGPGAYRSRLKRWVEECESSSRRLTLIPLYLRPAVHYVIRHGSRRPMSVRTHAFDTAVRHVADGSREVLS